MIRQVIILAAGMGTRLGKPWPKPLTPLKDGRTIMQQQMENITKTFGTDSRIGVVVGFKLEMIMEAHPRAPYIYNELYDQTTKSGLGSIADNGALCVNTGKFTGRSPENKFFIKDQRALSLKRIV